MGASRGRGRWRRAHSPFAGTPRVSVAGTRTAAGRAHVPKGGRGRGGGFDKCSLFSWRRHTFVIMGRHSRACIARVARKASRHSFRAPPLRGATCSRQRPSQPLPQRTRTQHRPSSQSRTPNQSAITAFAARKSARAPPSRGGGGVTAVGGGEAEESGAASAQPRWAPPLHWQRDEHRLSAPCAVCAPLVGCVLSPRRPFFGPSTNRAAPSHRAVHVPAARRRRRRRAALPLPLRRGRLLPPFLALRILPRQLLAHL